MTLGGVARGWELLLGLARVIPLRGGRDGADDAGGSAN